MLQDHRSQWQFILVDQLIKIKVELPIKYRGQLTLYQVNNYVKIARP